MRLINQSIQATINNARLNAIQKTPPKRLYKSPEKVSTPAKHEPMEDDVAPFEYFTDEPKKEADVLKTPTKEDAAEVITVQYKGGLSSTEKAKVRKPLRQFKDKPAIDGFISCTEEGDADIIDTIE
jgi:hypothetical protein